MTIAFIHPHKAFLPEIEAYSHFFSTYGIDTNEYRTGSASSIHAEIIWHFMGMDLRRNRNHITVHEYASASVGEWKKWKDLCKSILNTRPAFRLFLNDYVRNKIKFHDGVPFGIRDMGIDASLIEVPVASHPAKEYDFIYTGSAAADREPEKLLNCFTRNDLQQRSLLFLSSHYERLQQRFGRYPNIIFKGPVPQPSVKDYILRSRFAINYVPDKEPYNRQTSTKILEYAALQVPIISTQYTWLRNWQRDRGGDFFLLNEDLSNLNWEAIHAARYSFPDLGPFTWEKQIRRSGILEFLQSRIPDLDFKTKVEPRYEL